MLYETFETECVRLVKTRTPDGEGGDTSSWTDGDAFMAAIVTKSIGDTLLAESNHMEGTYTVTTSEALGFHSVFRREADGRTFRVIAVNDPTPEAASFAFNQYTAEDWELS